MYFCLTALMKKRYIANEGCPPTALATGETNLGKLRYSKKRLL